METDGKPAEAVPNGEDVPDVLPTNLCGIPLSWLKQNHRGHSGKNIDGIAKIPVVKEALFYNMDHKKRGVAIILNHEHFDIPNLKSRTGTAADCENLRTTLMSLGFEVRKYDDLTSSQIDHVLTLVSEEDHSDCDCILFALLSHGEQGMIYSKDSGYKSENLWSRFTADLCPTLAGKPKLFFIQACQGDKLDGGITVTTQVDSNSASPFKIPVHADFLIAYSTIPGYYSWRNTSRGSWFIQALCLELKENGFNYDLLTLLTFVNRRVAIDFESYVPGDYKMHAQKQIPCLTIMLTRLLKFKKKPDE
ncbi:caspase-1-like isoform X4 [Lycorma delicatula]|uniref:caspase-1-like isoform X4 n=1 Tax=Lycorma delicatula TaxID=130591 RepID=UPI003F514278